MVRKHKVRGHTRERGKTKVREYSRGKGGSSRKKLVKKSKRVKSVYFNSHDAFDLQSHKLEEDGYKQREPTINEVVLALGYDPNDMTEERWDDVHGSQKYSEFSAFERGNKVTVLQLNLMGG